MSPFEEEIILPLKRHLTGEADLEPFQVFEIEKTIRRCNNEQYLALLFDRLETVYSEFVAGRLLHEAYYSNHFMQLLMDLDVGYGRVLAHADIVDTALSWAEHQTRFRFDDFSNLLVAYGRCSVGRDWAGIEERVQREIAKLEVYGDRVKGGYLTVLHAFVRIWRSGLQPDEEAALFDLLEHHWDYLKLVYSVMIRSIVDCGHTDFAGVANNVRVMKSHHPYIHLFRVALKERMDDLCQAGTSQRKLAHHLAQITAIEKETPQGKLLDDLCQLLFPESFRDYLENNRMKSYDEIARELGEMKSQVEALNRQVAQMAQNMANAVMAAIPLEDIEKELLRLSPGISYDVFTQLNTLLIGNKAWSENASRIKDKVLALREQPTTQNNYNIEVVNRKETNIDKNYGPNIEHNGGSLSLPDNKH